MERHIGLDPHATTCTLAVIGPSGRKLRHDVVETNGAALVSYLGEHPRQEAPVPGGRDTQRLAVRDPLAARRGDRGRRHQREPWTEERRAGCIPAGRGTADGDDQDAGVQGSAAVQPVARARTRAFDAGAGRGSGASATESHVSRAGHRHAGQERLQSERARPMAELPAVTSVAKSASVIRPVSI